VIGKAKGGHLEKENVKQIGRGFKQSINEKREKKNSRISCDIRAQILLTKDG
jgi:hypothetical protein